VVVSDTREVEEVFRDWIEHVQEEYNVVSYFNVVISKGNYLAGFFLENFLELNIGFLCFSNLTAKRSRWRVAFDRTGRISAHMQDHWDKRVPPDVESRYRQLMSSIWHYIVHAAISAKRKQTWRAIYYLEEVRNRTVELCCMSRGLESRNYRQVHQLPEEFLLDLNKTLPTSISQRQIIRCLSAASSLYFSEARVLDEQLALSLAHDLEIVLSSFLAQFHKKLIH
jgi:hypothetical protein